MLHQPSNLGGIFRTQRACWFALPLLGGSLFAHAQTPQPVFEVRAVVTATDNGDLAPAAAAQRDLVFTLRPHVAIKRIRPGLRAELDLSLAFHAFARRTQPNVTTPQLAASLSVTAVERLLYLDAAARARRINNDPFQGQTPNALSATEDGQQRIEKAYQLSPYLERQLTSQASILARHDATVLHGGAGTDARLATQRSVVRFEQLPLPWGVALEWSRQESHAQGIAASEITSDAVRGTANVALPSDLVVGAVIGRERSRFLLNDFDTSVVGVALTWKPGARTLLSVAAERRFFGYGGHLLLKHRNPFLSLTLSLQRQPVIASALLGNVESAGSARELLDGLLTTRFPDASTRSALVDTTIAARGIDASVQGPIDAVAGYPQLQSKAQVAAVLHGTRNTAVLSLFSQTSQLIHRDGDALSAATLNTAFDIRQNGASLQFSRLLTPQWVGETKIQWSTVEGLGFRSGEVSEIQSFRLSLAQNVTSRSSWSMGFQHLRRETKASGQLPYRVNMVFAGINHRL